MYKRSSNLILFVFVLLFSGLTSHVFAVDVANTLKQSAQDTSTAASLFVGKTQVSDLYSKALHIVKQNEISSTNEAVNSVVAYFARQSCKVTANDVLNVFYSSDGRFWSFLKNLFSSIGTSSPTPTAINDSYYRFFACDNKMVGKKPSTEDFAHVQNIVSSIYYQSLTSVFYSSTLAQNNIGEDLFWNGNTGDSAFDLLSDINDIGEMFFITFKKAPEVLFYRLPTASSV